MIEIGFGLAGVIGEIIEGCDANDEIDCWCVGAVDFRWEKTDG